MTGINFIVVALVLSGCVGQASAQKNKTASASRQTKVININEDRLSGKREVHLTKQAITRILSFELNGTVDLKAPAKTAQQWASENAGITFTFAYGNGAFNDSEVNFIVDGSQVKSGDVTRTPGSLKDDQMLRDIFIGGITVGDLGKIANGRRVQLNLGNQVYDINKSARRNIRAFVAALKRK